MFGPGELDSRNIYIPNLDDITESARRTYGEANAFMRKEEHNLNILGRQILYGTEMTPEQIYDECHASASDLAKCCEMYLKAIFLYENKDSGKTCKELWEILEGKNEKNRRDHNGNTIYYQVDKDNETPLKHPDGTIIYVYAKVDDEGNTINGLDGNPIYIDKYGKEYSYSKKGRAVKSSGHALDRLIELISSKTRFLLEKRILTIPMDETEMNNSITIIDLLREKGLFTSELLITEDEFSGWLDHHKKTFEEARYSGQKNTDINVEFMFHLAKQIKAVAQYIINPKKKQQFVLTDEELNKLPEGFKEFATNYPHLMSEELIKKLARDNNLVDEINMIMTKSSNYIDEVSRENFLSLITEFNDSELKYVLNICKLASEDNTNIAAMKKRLLNAKCSDKTRKVVKTFIQTVERIRNYKLSTESIIDLFITIKKIYKDNLDYDEFVYSADILSEAMYGYDYNNINIKKVY